MPKNAEGSDQGVGCETPATHFDWETLYSPTSPLAVAEQSGVLRELPFTGFPWEMSAPVVRPVWRNQKPGHQVWLQRGDCSVAREHQLPLQVHPKLPFPRQIEEVCRWCSLGGTWLPSNSNKGDSAPLHTLLCWLLQWWSSRPDHVSNATVLPWVPLSSCWECVPCAPLFFAFALCAVFTLDNFFAFLILTVLFPLTSCKTDRQPLCVTLKQS